MRALVTGASGFVGGAVARALLQRGAAVRVLLRAGSSPNLPEAAEVEIARGDLRDAQAVCAAARGCDAIFHVAALYSFAAPASEVLAVNVGGTRQLNPRHPGRRPRPVLNVRNAPDRRDARRLPPHQAFPPTGPPPG